MKIKQKMIIGSALLVAIPVLIASVINTWVAISSSHDTIEDKVHHGLTAVRDMQAARIGDYFNLIESQIVTLSNQRTTIQAMRGFNESFDEYAYDVNDIDFDEAKANLQRYYEGPFDQAYKQKNGGISSNNGKIVNKLGRSALALQYAYISSNNHPLGEKNKLTSRADDTPYSATHALYHGPFNQFLTTFDYYDIFLVDMGGNVVYSVYKEVDFATNLEDGPFANSGLAKAYKSVKNAKDNQQVSFVDFSPYLPSYNTPASFIASPIFDGNHQIGVLIFQMPIDKINNIMTMDQKWQESGLGLSGEVYLVGEDKKARSISRFLLDDKEAYFQALATAGVSQDVISDIQHKETNIGIQTIDSTGVKNALAGQSHTEVIQDYRNVAVLSSYAPIQILGKKWAILSEIDEDEAYSELAALINSLILDSIITMAILIGLGVTGGLLFARSITTPVSTLSETVSEIEKNSDLTARIPVSSNDELGEMSESVNRMLEKFHQGLKQVNQTTDNVACSSEELSAVANQASESIHRQQGETDSVATAMNQMSSTVTEVSNSAAVAAEAAQEANSRSTEGKRIVNETIDAINALADEVDRANGVINNLENESEKIGGVLDVIKGIAEQTNLLALNAAIEAARAGEQGRGFAVVADEVRTLASRTQESTQEIQTMIERLQSGSSEAVKVMTEGKQQAENSVTKASEAGEALEAISQAVGKINDMNNMIATAAEEQSAVADEINQNITNISQVADETSAGASQITSESQNLAELSSNLREMVNQFKI